MKTARIISATVMAAAALTACGSDDDDDHNAAPSSWIRQQYSAATTGSGYVDSADRIPAVAKEIDGNTSARDRISAADVELLRYRDDIVAVTPLAAGGSRIEIDDYRTGYNRWQTRIGSVWPDPASSAFRGGGPGEGK
ncbi:DUF4247 domain-containing protein [Streptomyces genisteinicus]|uniref:DUF4247 domain-containing protein n=1 Tax=Streptomyces genisteinicus TaxID=2768068 RepID=A0A7H0HNE5_9ACTN|nr:DUF4247 domain-containing protein [Streptomyces genisteinicus]QNP62061.1 DUF4247 domain-containing protein [Streptomyces genisteinicus]